MSARVFAPNRVLFRGLLIGTLAVTAAGISAVAQPGGGPGGGLPPEERAKVEAAQAQAVAASLTLDAEKSAKLAEAYSAARKAAAESRPEGAPRGDFEAMLKIQEENRAKMQESFKSFLDETQAKEAASILSGNARQWDRFVAVILGFGLDEAKQTEALGHTLAYVKASIKAREDNAGAGNDGIRAAMAASKKTLDEAVAPLLNDAQKAEWTEKTARGPRGGGGGDERRRRGQGGDEGDAPTPGAPAAPAPGAPN
jgi:hypothetical protein